MCFQNIFECNICGIGFGDQLEFFMHLKQHYEPPVHQHMPKRKREVDCVTVENLIIHRNQQVEVVDSLPIESLDDSQSNIKDEESQRGENLPEIDEFNEFSEPEDLMEDLRKEVEKVVENIADNDCMRDATWNYQIYSENIEDSEDDGAHYEEIQAEVVPEVEETRDFDEGQDGDDIEEDEEDDKPLDQVRKSLQQSIIVDSEQRKPPIEVDKEDLELNECLKKIHNFKCNTCNKAFNSRTALGYHLKTHTTGECLGSFGGCQHIK